jgi:membrane fusion protein (multidrug efflux system)
MSDINPGAKAPKRKITIIIVNSVLVILVIAAIIWGISTYFNLDSDVYTNDAQVDEYISPVNARIPGYLASVRFQEHQHIHKGDTLVTIDDSEYKIQVEQAEAAYLSALAARNVTTSSVSTVQSNIRTSDSEIAASKAKLWNAQQNYRRFANLLRDGAATQQQFDQVKTEYDALNSQTQALMQQRNTVHLTTDETSKRVNVNDAEIKRAKAALDLARLNLSYTIIIAPYEGYTGRRNVQEGQLVEPGQNLLSFVRIKDKWIVANYRETQISKIQIGQRVSMVIDGLGNRKLEGKVTAISEATGSRYSAVPVDNSTGNFVKVQQRIPVKIELLPQYADVLDKLRAGMNVEVRLLNN